MDYLDELIETRKSEDSLFAQIWGATELVDELASRRAALGLSQQEIANRMGVARARVSEIENHPERVSFARILAYATSVGAQFEVTAPAVVTAKTPASKGRPVVARGANFRKGA